MEKNSEINISLLILISLFLHIIIFFGMFLPDYSTFIDWIKKGNGTLRGGRDIIVNINQDKKSVVTRRTLLSDKDSSAKGYITTDRGDRWLNNSLDFKLKRGSRTMGRRASSGHIGMNREKKILLADNNEIIVSIMKYDLGGFDVFGDDGEDDFIRIPDRYNVNRNNAIFYSNDGQFSFNTKKFKNFKYFKNMKDKIAGNWRQMLPQMANVNIGGYAPGYIRIRAIQSQEVKLYFTMNRRGDVLDVVIVDSLGNEPLDRSCVQSIRLSKNFGRVPDNIKGDVIIIPFMFGYYIY